MTPEKKPLIRIVLPTTGELREKLKITPPGPADFLKEAPPYHRPGIALPVESTVSPEETKKPESKE